MLSKAGEIAIVRANQTRTAKEYERKMIALQHLHATDTSRKSADLQRAMDEKERVATENRFLKRDLTEEGEKVKNLRRSIKDVDTLPGKAALARGDVNASPLTTPRKGKGLPYRDGFDDEEVLASPTRPASGKFRRGTPKAGAKRKRRPMDDSPGQALQLSQPRESTDLGTRPVEEIQADALQKLGQDDGRFEVGWSEEWPMWWH